MAIEGTKSGHFAIDTSGDRLTPSPVLRHQARVPEVLATSHASRPPRYQTTFVYPSATRRTARLRPSNRSEFQPTVTIGLLRRSPLRQFRHLEAKPLLSTVADGAANTRVSQADGARDRATPGIREEIDDEWVPLLDKTGKIRGSDSGRSGNGHRRVAADLTVQLRVGRYAEVGVFIRVITLPRVPKAFLEAPDPLSMQNQGCRSPANVAGSCRKARFSARRPRRPGPWLRHRLAARKPAASWRLAGTKNSAVASGCIAKASSNHRIASRSRPSNMAAYPIRR